MTENPSTPLPARDDHYSYATYADPHMAETFEAARFGGPIGRLLAETQEQVIAGFLSPLTGTTILDVGTGTGRAAIALARRGAIVTGIDASAEMLAVARRRALEAGAAVTFVQGDAHGLNVADRSFDAVVCLRVLMHTPDWRQSLAELCRAARHRVVLDYPARSSAAALQSVARRIAHAFGARVEAYRVFGHREIRDALGRRTASGSPIRTSSSCCRSPFTSSSDRRRPPAGSKICWRRRGCVECSARRSRSWRREWRRVDDRDLIPPCAFW